MAEGSTRWTPMVEGQVVAREVPLTGGVVRAYEDALAPLGDVSLAWITPQGLLLYW